MKSSNTLHSIRHLSQRWQPAKFSVMRGYFHKIASHMSGGGSGPRTPFARSACREHKSNKCAARGSHVRGHHRRADVNYSAQMGSALFGGATAEPEQLSGVCRLTLSVIVLACGELRMCARVSRRFYVLCMDGTMHPTVCCTHAQ